jgi:hypothetical protein
MARRRYRISSASLSIGFLICLAAGFLGCRYKIVSGGALDRQAIVKASRRVSEVRQLPFVSKVSFRLAGTADIRRTASAEAGQLRLSGRAEREAKLLALLGLIPFGSDPAGAVESMIASQPAGLYLPRADRLEIVAREHFRSEVIEVVGLFVGRDLTFGEIVSHELTHALQDQHFGLDHPPQAAENQDAQLAHVALVEGDATLVGFELGVGGLVADPEDFVNFARKHAPDMGERVPAYMQERFKFPYLDGSNFVLALKKQGGWETVNRAYRNPPRSTEEVLHPEKYRTGDDPPRLPDLSDLTVTGYQPIYQDTLGEFGIRILLSGANRKLAARRAAGWGGDRAAVFERTKGGGLLLVWVTDWDTPADAAEFMDGMEEVLSARTSAERSRHLELWDHRVVLVDGPQGCDLYPVMHAAWLSGTQKPPEPVRPAESPKEPLDIEQAVVVDPHVPKMIRSGPLVRLGNESAGATLGGFLQIRGEDGMSVQRVRTRIDGKVSHLLDLGMYLELELNGKDPLLQDAKISFAPVSPHLLYLGHFHFGRFRIPFSRSTLLDPEHLSLNERPLLATYNQAPERRVGAMYDIDMVQHGLPLRLRAGAFQGYTPPEGKPSGTLAAVRLDFTPSHWLGKWMDIGFGAAYLWDDNHQDDVTGLSYDWHGVNLNLHIGYRGFWAEGELLLLDRASGDGLESKGWAVTAGAFLLPDFLELVGRYEELHIPETPMIRQISGGLNLLYLADRFKMVYNFIYREEDDIDQKRHMIVFQLLL